MASSVILVVAQFRKPAGRGGDSVRPVC